MSVACSVHWLGRDQEREKSWGYRACVCCFHIPGWWSEGWEDSRRSSTTWLCPPPPFPPCRTAFFILLATPLILFHHTAGHSLTYLESNLVFIYFFYAAMAYKILVHLFSYSITTGSFAVFFCTWFALFALSVINRIRLAPESHDRRTVPWCLHRCFENAPKDEPDFLRNTIFIFWCYDWCHSIVPWSQALRHWW